MSMFEHLAEQVYRYGPAGLFLVAFISNAIPYSTVPYLVLIAPLLGVYRGRDLLVSILALALGATLGKVVVYFVGRGLASINKIGKALSGLRTLTRMHKHATFIVVFTAAALPIPDDVFYIPVGMSRYNVTPFIIAVLLGKLIITTLAALYGRAVRYILEEVAGVPTSIQVPLMVAITLTVALVANSIDWEGVSTVYKKKGVVKAFEYMIESIPGGIKKTFKNSGKYKNTQ